MSKIKTKIKTKNGLKALCATGCAMVMGLAAFPASLGTAYALNTLGTDGKAYTDYATLEEAQSAAADLNVQIMEEGTVLLKNKDNALPMEKNAYVSVFGGASDGISGKLLTDALREEGFKVNPKLEQMYADDSTNSEITEFNSSLRNSFDAYSDAAIIVLARRGGEAWDGGGSVMNDDVSDAAE